MRGLHIGPNLQLRRNCFYQSHIKRVKSHKQLLMMIGKEQFVPLVATFLAKKNSVKKLLYLWTTLHHILYQKLWIDPNDTPENTEEVNQSSGGEEDIEALVDRISSGDGFAALEKALQYVEQQPESTP